MYAVLSPRHLHDRLLFGVQIWALFVTRLSPPVTPCFGVISKLKNESFRKGGDGIMQYNTS